MEVTENKTTKPVRPTAKSVDDNREMLSDFDRKVDTATIIGKEWVETSPEIIGYFNPRGLGGADYFHYKKVKVCEYGKSEAIQEKIEADRKVAGEEGIVISGGGL